MRAILALILSLMLILPASLAQAGDIDPGITPRHPLWKWEMRLEKLLLRLPAIGPLGKEAKIESRIAFIEERLAELQDVVDDSDYSDEIEDIQEALEDENEELDEELPKMSEAVQVRIEERREAHFTRFQALVDRLENDDNPNNDHALPALKSALAKQQGNFERFKTRRAAKVPTVASSKGRTR